MNNRFQRTGILFVLSAPSGAGKTTLCASLRQTADFVYAVSCTTRAPRPGEVDGEHYFFLTEEKFVALIDEDAFLEHAHVHGRRYGTLKSTVVENLQKGLDVLIDIDTEGARFIRACDDAFILDALADIFIMPPDLDELRRRLLNRGSETEDQIAVRISNAAHEMERWQEYKYTIISGSAEADVESFRSVMRAERFLSRRMEANA